MEINFHKESKLVDIWLSHEDQASQATQDRLRSIYRRCAEEKYTVAVFYSGQQDLAEETGALLRYNRRRCAERSVQREKGRKRQASRSIESFQGCTNICLPCPETQLWRKN